MSNLALKYRPKRFEDVIGQSSSVKILVSILDKVRKSLFQLPAGMLFCGSKGTGKTSSARIVAMSLNCEDVVNSPCGVCRNCKDIIEARSTSVVEIDAASHGLVEDIRKLRELSSYAHPGRYRVFIIDECHSMSSAAFNSLLKVLEEPPPFTLFILATTEPDKVLETVQSRLMLFEFRRISVDFIIERLKYIREQEKIEVEEEVLSAIGEYANGGLRDAIVMLEQLSFYSQEKIFLKDFKEVFGIVEVSVFKSLVQSILDKDYSKGQEVVQMYFCKASEGRLFLEGLARYFKDMLLRKIGVETKVEVKQVSALTEKQILDSLNVVWELLIKASYTGAYYRLMSEVGFVQLVRVLSNAQVVSSEKIHVKSAASIVRTMSNVEGV